MDFEILEASKQYSVDRRILLAYRSGKVTELCEREAGWGKCPFAKKSSYGVSAKTLFYLAKIALLKAEKLYQEHNQKYKLRSSLPLNLKELLPVYRQIEKQYSYKKHFEEISIQGIEHYLNVLQRAWNQLNHDRIKFKLDYPYLPQQYVYFTITYLSVKRHLPNGRTVWHTLNTNVYQPIPKDFYQHVYEYHEVI